MKAKDACILGIYLFVIFSAIAYMQYTLDETSYWRLAYTYSIFVIVGLNLLFFILVIMDDRCVEIDICPGLLFVILIYEIIVSIMNQLFFAEHFIVDGFPWICIIISFYHYTKENDIPIFFKTISVASLIAICVLSIQNIIRHDGNSIFSTYFCMTFLPILFFTTTKKTSFTFCFIIVILMLFTLKRGAFTISVIGVFIYSMLLLHNEQMKIRKRRMFLITI